MSNKLSNKFSEIPPNVKKRLVFYVPGFDPMPPNRYRELYRAEAEKQSEISGHKINVDRLSTLNGTSRFSVEAEIDGAKANTEFRFLTWNDLVADTMNIPIWMSWLKMFKVGKVIAGSGALFRLMKLQFTPNIAGLYPFLFIPLQIITAALLGLYIGKLAAPFLSPEINGLRHLIALLIFILIVLWWRRRDNKHYAYYMLHDLIFICKENGYTPPELRERMEAFKAEISSLNYKDFDEILLIGHSSGAHIAALLMAELIREGKIKRQDNFALLTLGQDIPLVSYLPGASDLRLALNELANQDAVDWVDFSAPSDGACFALTHPVLSSVKIDEGAKYPRVLSAAFSQSLSPNNHRKLKYRFFRLHFQYLCHFDNPILYDYFQITSGPLRLWARFGALSNSPSMDTSNYNGFTDMSP